MPALAPEVPPKGPPFDPKGPERDCVFCRMKHRQQLSTALYPEAFCSAWCERRFVEHVAEFYAGKPE